jgi:hypothetical protein
MKSNNMQEIVKNKIYLGNKKDYLNGTFKEKDWAFVHIGIELYIKCKSSEEDKEL